MKNNSLGEDSLNDNVNQYFNAISSLNIAIDSVKTEKYSMLFQKLLYLGLLDTLSKCFVNPKDKPRQRNHVRFVSFISRFCNWKDGSRISLPHLVKYLELMQPNPKYNQLKAFVSSEYKRWSNDEIVRLNRDPEYSTIESMIPKSIEDKNLSNFTHYSLLWGLRNSFVHELRGLGYGFDELVDKEPGYHQMNMVDSMKEREWQLVYPKIFIKQLIAEAIKNLKGHCLKNKVNPYKCYNFGSYWIEEFNSPR